MADTEAVRLECLKAAMAQQGARDKRSVLEIADDFFAWVTRETKTGQAAKAPADDGKDRRKRRAQAA